MDTRILDVAIGLVLVFALTSLLVTAWQEALASMKNSRGENLRKAIASLLGDDSAWAQRLLDHPLLKSMAMERPGQSQRLPSYIAPDVFVNALLAQLTGDYTGGLRPATPAELVAQLQAKLPAAQQPFGLSLMALASGVEQDWAAFENRLMAWFNAVGERSIGWFKRGTQWQMFAAGCVVAASMNINPLLIVSALWADAALRQSVVAQAGVAVQNYQKETGLTSAKPAPAPTPAAAPSLAPARQASRDLIDTLQVLLSSGGQANPTQITELLRSGYEMKALLDPEKPASQAQLELQMRKLQTQLHNSEITQQLAAQASTEALQQSITALAPPSPASSAATPVPSNCDKLPAEERELCAKRKMLRDLEGLGLPLGWAQAGLPTLLPTSCNGGNQAEPRTAPSCTLGQQMSEAGWWGNLLLALLGWAGTALAVTLGAPFWFDLLGRLVKIRAAGGKPTDAAASGTAAGAAPSTLTPSTPATDTGSTAQNGGDQAMNDAMNEAEKQLTPNEIGTLQKHLRMAVADISLRLDIKTRDAIMAWQTQAFGQGDGILSAQQIAQILSEDFDSQDDGFLG